jgi:hypothetical protein
LDGRDEDIWREAELGSAATKGEDQSTLEVDDFC